MTPTQAVEREVDGHLDNHIGANSGVGSAWRSPAVRRQPLGPRVGLLLGNVLGGGKPVFTGPAFVDSANIDAVAGYAANTR